MCVHECAAGVQHTLRRALNRLSERTICLSEDPRFAGVLHSVLMAHARVSGLITNAKFFHSTHSANWHNIINQGRMISSYLFPGTSTRASTTQALPYAATLYHCCVPAESIFTPTTAFPPRFLHSSIIRCIAWSCESCTRVWRFLLKISESDSFSMTTPVTMPSGVLIRSVV